jgi:glutaredoxin 3
MADVKIYTTQWCPYCNRAKSLLRSKGVDFTEIPVDDDPDTRARLVKATGQHTVPQIFINDESVGGSDELHALDRQGRLDDMLAAPARSAR